MSIEQGRNCKNLIYNSRVNRKENQMKIVFLSYLHGFGGAEKQNVMLANAMANQGHDVTLISICAENNCYQLDENVKYHFLPDRKSNVLRIITRYRDVKKKLIETKPDVTINFWFQSAYLTALMKKSITGKIIYSERGDPGDKEYNGILGWIRRLTLPRIDGFVFQSKGAQGYFNKFVQARSTVIPNPVFVKREDFPEVKTRKKKIVTVGRLHPQKNQKLLITAFSLIADHIPEYTLEIYGEGELKDELQKQINELHLTDKVFLKGTSKKIHELIYDASLFVLSSDYEGIPNTLLEAMALGIPCISTDCRPGGAREVITSEKNGYIVPINDEVKLADKILQVLVNIQQAQAIANEAIKISQVYSPDAIYKEWQIFLNHVCGRSNIYSGGLKIMQ